MFFHPTFVNVGSGNLVQADRVLAVIRPGSVTARRYLKLAREKKKCIDATNKHTARSVLLLDDGTVMISNIKTLTLLRRFRMEHGAEDDELQEEKEESAECLVDDDSEEEEEEEEEECEDCEPTGESPEA